VRPAQQAIDDLVRGAISADGDHQPLAGRRRPVGGIAAPLGEVHLDVEI